jgi:hypothetical protein
MYINKTDKGGKATVSFFLSSVPDTPSCYQSGHLSTHLPLYHTIIPPIYSREYLLYTEFSLEKSQYSYFTIHTIKFNVKSVVFMHYFNAKADSIDRLTHSIYIMYSGHLSSSLFNVNNVMYCAINNMNGNKKLNHYTDH